MGHARGPPQPLTLVRHERGSASPQNQLTGPFSRAERARSTGTDRHAHRSDIRHSRLSSRFKTGGRTLSLQPCELQEALDYARAQQADEQWRAKYATRADIEGPINQAVAVIGIRGARYHGLHETHLEHGKATPSTAPEPARPT
ncbi:transposase [Streptomyces sp. NPDC001212]